MVDGDSSEKYDEMIDAEHEPQTLVRLHDVVDSFLKWLLYARISSLSTCSVGQPRSQMQSYCVRPILSPANTVLTLALRFRGHLHRTSGRATHNPSMLLPSFGHFLGARLIYMINILFRLVNSEDGARELDFCITASV